MSVRKVMQSKGSNVSTAAPTDTVQMVMDQLELDEVSAVVVTDDTKAILGIVSGGDILRALNRHGPEALKLRISEVMATDVFTCEVAEPLSRIFELMDTNQIRHVPIIENGQLCGIINTLDVVKHRLNEIALEADALKDYVSGRG